MRTSPRRRRRLLMAAVFAAVLASLLVWSRDKDTTFSESAGGSGTAKVTFIDLGSVDCIPCRMMQPVMREIEKLHPRDVEVVFHDVWTEKGRPYAQKYGIRLIPTQVFLDSRGEEYFRHEGYFRLEEVLEVRRRQGVER